MTVSDKLIDKNRHCATGCGLPSSVLEGQDRGYNNKTCGTNLLLVLALRILSEHIIQCFMNFISHVNGHNGLLIRLEAIM